MKSSPKKDSFVHISLQIKALELCGIWFFIPYPVKSFKFWFHILCRIFIGISVFIVPLLGQSICLIRLILSGNAEIQEIAGIINLILTELLISLKLLDLRSRRDLLRELKRQMERKEFLHFHGPQKDIVRNSIELSKKLFVWLSAIAAADITIHIIVVPAILNFQVLPVRMDFIFFDVLESPYFSFFFIYQIIYKPILLVTFASLQTMRWAFMLCTISQLDVLIYNFKNMKEVNNGDKTKIESIERVFKINVLHHCAIKQYFNIQQTATAAWVNKFVNKIEDTFGGQFVLFFIINSCIICTTATQFVSIKNPLNHIMELFWIFGFLFIMVIILFIDCYFGTTITQKNSHISTIVYCYQWINLPQRMKKNFIIFIGRNQRTLGIRALKVIPVSMATFTKVINWTYKGFTVLNQMKK